MTYRTRSERIIVSISNPEIQKYNIINRFSRYHKSLTKKISKLIKENEIY